MSADNASEKDPTPEAGPPECSYEDFMKLDLRVAEVLAAEAHPNADKLLKLRIGVGATEKQICAGVRADYAPETLVGKRLIVVNNLAPRKIRGEVSEGMLLAATDQSTGALTLLTTDDPAFPSGSGVR